MSSDYHSDISGNDFDYGENMAVEHFKDENMSDSERDLGKWLAENDMVMVKKVKEPVNLPYKFREAELMKEIQAYIDATYGEHYSRTKFQASEIIFDSGHGVGMNIGCIMKYAQRYGKKDGYNRKDILKIIHYAILLLYVHDEYIAKESK